MNPDQFDVDVCAEKIALIVAERMLEKLANPQGLLTTKPWKLLNISPATWHRMSHRPHPVQLPGIKRQWRVADILDFVKNLKPIRRRCIKTAVKIDPSNN